MKYIKANIEVLDSLEEQRIHDASIDILGKVGIHMPEKNILTLFEAAGADVDRDTQIIKIPEELVLTVLEKIRDDSSNTTEHRAIPNLGITVTPQPFIADYPGKYRRYGTLNDVIKGIVITNRLRHLIFANPIVVPNDVPVPISDLYSYQALYMYSNNPGNAYINSEWS
ncbi:MAG: trimethylamine methyltransferase family protein, partial [Clostridiaceae bacterium]|nr:trimethylamine methyltransferase family protein [Clostridiaceae bacterium]